MKKLICLIAAVVLVFTACGNKDPQNSTAPDGMIEDGDGIINEEHNAANDNISDGKDVVDDAADGVNDVVDGAAEGTKDVVDGAKNAVDNMTGNR